MLWAVEQSAAPSVTLAPGRALERATTEGYRPLRWATRVLGLIGGVVGRIPE